MATLEEARAELEEWVAERTAELRALSAQSESILNSAGEGIWGINYDGRTVFANNATAELTGYSVAELLTSRMHDLVHHTRPDGTAYPVEECPVHDTLRSGDVHHVSDELYFRMDGTSFPVEYTSTPLREHGVLKGAVVVFKDISARQRAERERAELERRLAQSQRLESVGQLAGGIAHDFNNLLAVILNYAAFVREELPEGDPIGCDVAEIQHAAERAAALTRQLLVFSCRERAEVETLDLNAIVAEMEKLLRRTLGEDVELRTELAERLPTVKADRAQIEQVLLNLALNARDAMPEGGTLTIVTQGPDRGGQTSSATGRSVSLRVSDTGCGMTEDVAARAFEPFFSTKPKDLGSGLGLATVYGIVAQAGGEIGLDSAPGCGTVVAVTLPATDEEVARSPEPAGTSAPAITGKEVVLLVEDEEAVREATRRILSRHGHTVIPAARADEALGALAKIGPAIDVLVTDVVMPEMSGRELAERVREVHPSMGVVYISGYTDDIVSRHGGLEPGVPFLQKPFDASGLLAGVQQALPADRRATGA